MKFGDMEIQILSDGTHTENGWYTYFYHEISFSIGIINKITNAKGEMESKVEKAEIIS